MVLLATACGADPQPLYTIADTTVARGTTRLWAFDADGAWPGVAEVFEGSWAPRAELGAPSAPSALCQTATGSEFPALRFGADVWRDATVSTWFQPVSGEEDQAAGIAFRIQDARNYYLVRANALEGNVAFYLVGDGTREQMGRDAEADVALGVWQELRLEIHGARFTAFLDGDEVLTHEDSTFPAGGIGLWTKADSVTCFDTVTATAR